MATGADVLKKIKDEEVKFVDLRFTDFRGKEQHVQVPEDHFDAAKFTEGHAFDGSSIAGWKGIEAYDMLLMPDPSTAIIDPFIEETTLNHEDRCGRHQPGSGRRLGSQHAGGLQPLVQRHPNKPSQGKKHKVTSSGQTKLAAQQYHRPQYQHPQPKPQPDHGQRVSRLQSYLGSHK